MHITRPGLAATTAIAAGVVATTGLAAVAAGTGTVEPPPRIAFVTRSDNPADALAVGPTAGQLGAPVFVTAPNSLVPATEAGLVGYAPELVIIAGGQSAISSTVEAAIEAAVGLPDDQVVRAAGEDRFATAVAIADLLATHRPAYLPADATAMEALVAQTAETIGGLDAAQLATTDDLGGYVVEMDVGDEPRDFATVGPLTYSAHCEEDAGEVRGRVEVRSSHGPWYLYEVPYAADESAVVNDRSAPIGTPDWGTVYAVVSVPDLGVYVVDDGYRNIVLFGLPGADCRFAGHLLPLQAS